MTIMTMSVFERDSTVVECNSRRGECMTCCLIHCGVLQEVNAVVATTIRKRTIWLVNLVEEQLVDNRVSKKPAAFTSTCRIALVDITMPNV